MADPAEVMNLLESLATHCRPPLMSVDAKSRWMADWCADLKPYPVEDIEAACRRWRQSENTKFPMPGQLLPLLRAQTKPTAEGAPNNQAWTWPTDDELAAMTLRERRRSLLIMAHETRSKAGPMDRDGKVKRPQFIDEAKAYTDEAARISTLLASFKDAAE